MAIDWTPVPVVGGTGKAEFRVENDGLVRWRGILTKTDAALASLFVSPLPLSAVPVDHTTSHIDWSAIASDFNGFIAGTVLYVGYYGVAGQQFDLSGVLWRGTPPPPNPHNLEGVQAGLADALRTIVGLRVYDFPSDRVEPPAAVLSLPETPYDVTLSGRSDEWTFPLWVLVAKANDKSAYGEMVDYLEAEGTKSIRAAVEADRTLGGACDTAAIVRARPLFATVAGTEFLAVEFTLEVYT